MPSPISNVKLVEKADTTSPAASPSMEPKLICLTAAGLIVFPSFVRGTLGPREFEEVLLNSAVPAGGGEWGEESSLMMDEDWMKGREAVSPNATRTGRLRAGRARGADIDFKAEGKEREGRITVRSSIVLG
ncbi:hypothetical protein AYO21_02621 [Fonsecaea monophora]|uniref:Uncharacterized protein n=1 Tax=Fonsecaea monophora TaxID=254056 RepID=A0A177FHV9_9EURO|nr:hypothetical protein AYO21_02621 [Fonsecaea monophora]OAG43002.1 hypothetical protein AYO21_02621 [Fonsecaea monophora]